MIINLLNGIEFENPDLFNLEGAAATIFYFTIYSLLGWLLENSYNFLTKREFLKPNFLYGPFKPMYGFTPVLLVYLISPESNIGVAMLFCLLIPTIVEYLTGAMLQKLFNRKWWDYTDAPMQLHGHICLSFSLSWMILSLLCIKWVHPGIVSLYDVVEPFWTWVWSAIGLYFLADLVLAIRKHSLQVLLTEKANNQIQ